MELKRLEAIEVSVEVVWDDIRYGLPSEKCLCPVAMAIDRALNSTWTGHQFMWTEVTYNGVFTLLETDGYQMEHMQAVLPAMAKQFIHSFDADRTVQPFSFRICFEAKF